MIALERSLPLPVALLVVAVVFAVWVLAPMVRRHLQWRQLGAGSARSAARRDHPAGTARLRPTHPGTTARPRTMPYPLPEPYARRRK